MNLGTLYVSGKGVPLDYVEGFVWVAKAKKSGVKEADAILAQLRQVMTPKQVKIAESRLSNISRDEPHRFRDVSSIPSDDNGCPLVPGTTSARRSAFR